MGLGWQPGDPRILQIDPAERWRERVKQYFKKSLTVVTNSILLSPGLVQRWAAMEPGLGLFVAGLWGSDILGNLLWKVTTYPLNEQSSPCLGA